MEFITENHKEFFAIKEMNRSFIKNVRLYAGTDDHLTSLEEVEKMYKSGKHFAEMTGIEFNNCDKIRITVK